MSRRPGTAALAAVLVLITACQGGNPASGEASTPQRTPTRGAEQMNSVSLQFAEYRGDPAELASRVDRYLAGARQEVLSEDPLALVVPHAGYVYSGPVAAWAYQSVRGKKYDTVIIVGPSHRVPFTGISVLDAASIDTPLGRIPVDTDLSGLLLASHREVAFRPEAHLQEHSVEVQLPFLQRVLPGVKVVLAVMGAPSREAEDAFVATLAKARINRRILLLASSDLSHYHDYATARKMDADAVSLVLGMDPDRLLRSEQQGTCELCGILPVHLAMKLANTAGPGRGVLLHAASSGDTAGGKDQVVGYAAIALFEAEAPGSRQAKPAAVKAAKAADSATLDPARQKRLLEIARQSIASQVATGAPPEMNEKDPALQIQSGAFVTIERQGRLRGCIGTFVARGEPLWRTVRSMAVAAASQDPRFSPLSQGELDDGIDLEISVLTPMRRITDVGEIEPGRHGLYIVKGYHSGTLLPQVATDYGWDRLTFLQETCRKAGLPPDAWKEGTEIYVYEAQVFGEH